MAALKETEQGIVWQGDASRFAAVALPSFDELLAVGMAITLLGLMLTNWAPVIVLSVLILVMLWSWFSQSRPATFVVNNLGVEVRCRHGFGAERHYWTWDQLHSFALLDQGRVHRLQTETEAGTWSMCVPSSQSSKLRQWFRRAQDLQRQSLDGVIDEAAFDAVRRLSEFP